MGIDGNPKGWSVAYRDSEERIQISSFPSLQEIGNCIPNVSIIAIDMIIGLPNTAEKGGREADREARRLLSPRGSVLFSAPCRDSVYATSYREALAISCSSTPQSIGLSKQSYLLAPKIRELDAFLRTHPSRKNIFKETHPELSFWEMNNRIPLPSKHSKEGALLRTKLLEKEGLLPVQKLSKDDMDALACLWSAIRIQNNQSNRVPKEASFDRFGIPMQITWQRKVGER